MLAQDLMGLGVSPLIAARTANAGTGPLTIVAAGSAFSSATKIGATQYVCSNATAGGLSVALPTVGTDGGAYLGDDYLINNAVTASLNVFLSTGVAISANGTLNSSIVLSSHQTLACFPIKASLWIGVLGN